MTDDPRASTDDLAQDVVAETARRYRGAAIAGLAVALVIIIAPTRSPLPPAFSSDFAPVPTSLAPAPVSALPPFTTRPTTSTTSTSTSSSTTSTTSTTTSRTTTTTTTTTSTTTTTTSTTSTTSTTAPPACALLGIGCE